MSLSSTQSSHSAANEDGRPTQGFQSAKARKILDACRRRDIDHLKGLAESQGGFLTDSLRQQAWPILLGLPLLVSRQEDEKQFTDGDDIPPPVLLVTDEGDWKKLYPHRDEGQVELDVNRSFIYYPNHKSEHELDARKVELSDLIVEVLRRYPYLCYFQGYHDICQVFLLVLPAPLRAPAVARLSALRIRDFMLPTLDAAVSQLRLIPSILRAADPGLCHHLRGTEPFFALSGTLTMYAHDIQSLGEIARFFDVLLAREPVFSVYMFAQIVLNRREELFDTPSDESDILGSILSKLPQPLNLEALITDAVRLIERYPPETLKGWRGSISDSSVLKTARSTSQCAGQSMEVGRLFFDQQVLEWQRAERRKMVLAVMWKYRRPAGTVGLAVAFGVLAFWMRRHSVGNGPLAYLASYLSRWRLL